MTTRDIAVQRISEYADNHSQECKDACLEATTRTVGERSPNWISRLAVNHFVDGFLTCWYLTRT